MLWAGIILITVCTVMIIIWPLLRDRAGDHGAPDRTEYDVELYKDQLKEIDRDLDRDLLSTAQADAARTEIQRKLLAAAEGGQSTSFGSVVANGGSKIGAVVLSLFLIASAGGLYLHLGTPGLDNLSYASRDIKAEEAKQQRPQSGQGGQAGQAGQEMQALLDKLARRLEQNPDDVKGWLLLGRSMITRGRFNESAAAYKHAYALDPEDPEIAADYAEAMIFSAKGQINDDAYVLLKSALAKSPNNPKIRYYIGLRKAQNDDPMGALQDWTDIAAMSPDGAPWMPTVMRQINEAIKNTGIDPAAITPSKEALAFAKENGISTDISPGAPGPSREDMQAASQMSPEDQNAMIRGMVSRLAERLKDEPDDIGGWKRLARAYQVLGEENKAKDALDRIKVLQNR